MNDVYRDRWAGCIAPIGCRFDQRCTV